MKCAVVFLLALSVARVASAQTPYDLLLKGGHVIDGSNGIDAVRDVAIKDGKIAAVAANIPSTQATKTVDAAGLYVTPGLVDIHVHGYHGEKGTAYAGGPLGVPIDAFSLRSCVTTVADAGSSGWRNFDDFKARIIDKSKTRVTAFINIVGYGMGGGTVEQNLADMEVQPTADMALKHKGVIVGIKSAHFNGPEWAPYERAVEAGTIAGIPVMVDFGSARVRTIKELFERVFRPGDIYTHAYSGGSRGELIEGKVNPAIFAAQKKGIIFDLGHGGGSFVWQTAVQAFKEGYYPNSLSSDLHVTSMNAGMKDMTNIMSKFLALGMALKDVVVRSTWNPAKEIKLEQLGNLSVGAPADIAVLRLEKGKFGFLDQRGGRLDGTQKLGCEMTVRDGAVVYDLNGIAGEAWDKMAPPPPEAAAPADSRAAAVKPADRQSRAFTPSRPSWSFGAAERSTPSPSRVRVPNGNFQVGRAASRRWRTATSGVRWDNRPGDEIIRQNRSLGRHHHGAGGCREYRLLYAVQHSSMVRGVRDAGAPRVHPRLPSRTWNPRRPSAADRPRTGRIHVPRRGQCFTLGMRSGGGGWCEAVSQSAYRLAGSLSQRDMSGCGQRNTG